MSPFEAVRGAFAGGLFVLAAVVSSVGLGCRGRNKCEEFRDIELEWNDRCEAGREISMGEVECPEEDARVAQCLIPCYRLPCAAPAADFNACVDACE